MVLFAKHPHRMDGVSLEKFKNFLNLFMRLYKTIDKKKKKKKKFN
jgi:hypothetical protein